MTKAVSESRVKKRDEKPRPAFSACWYWVSCPLLICLASWFSCPGASFAQAKAPPKNTTQAKTAPTVATNQMIQKPGFLDLLIELKGSPYTETIDDTVVEFSKTCPEFGKLFVSNNGLWGSGPFQNYQCRLDEKSVGGPPFVWKLTALADGDSTSFIMTYRDPVTGRELVQSEYKLDSAVSPLRVIKESRSAALLAAYLNFGLPFRSAVAPGVVRQGGDLGLQGVQLNDINPPTVPLVLFRLRRNGDRWQFSKVGSARYEQASNPPKWTVDALLPESETDSTDSVTRDRYFLHHAVERAETSRKLADALDYELDSLLGKLLGVARSVYIGGRYGTPMGKGEGVFTKTPLIGFFGEFRGGILAGMHVYYDVIPKQKGKDLLVSQEFSWSRFQVGYGFGRAFDSSIVNWVDIMPKLGVTNLNLISVPSAKSKERPYSFKLSNAPTVGLEIGVERRSEKNLLRLWSYASYGLGVLIDKKVKTTGFRSGFDVYRELVNFGSTKMAMLVFAAYDATTFKKILTADDQKKDPYATDLISYHSFFLGGGLAVTW